MGAASVSTGSCAAFIKEGEVEDGAIGGLNEYYRKDQKIAAHHPSTQSRQNPLMPAVFVQDSLFLVLSASSPCESIRDPTTKAWECPMQVIDFEGRRRYVLG